MDHKLGFKYETVLGHSPKLLVSSFHQNRESKYTSGYDMNFKVVDSLPL